VTSRTVGHLGVRRIERLEAGDWERLRAIRLDALADEPDAFGSSLDAERAYDEARWRQLAALPWWLAVSEEGDVGLVSGGRRDPDDTTRFVYSMWVAPNARGSGIAEDLLDAVVAWARGEGAVRLGLEVTNRVPRARRFYERYGFTATGVEDPLGRDASIVLIGMALVLDAAT
jgi:GNAT superfamily N-acetyltransferase